MKGSTGALVSASDETARAWQSCFLADLPAALAEELLDRAAPIHLRSGESLLRGGVNEDRGVYVLASGLVRIYLIGPDGRQATVRYATDGEVVGLPPLLVPDMDIWGEAVTEVEAIRLSARRFTALAERDVELAWPTARYVAQQLASSNDVLAADIFLPIRARIARHLLDLARRDPAGTWRVEARHQDLADAIGSVREVVSRETRRLAATGAIRQVPGGIVLDDPAELHRIATAARGRPAQGPSSASLAESG